MEFVNLTEHVDYSSGWRLTDGELHKDGQFSLLPEQFHNTRMSDGSFVVALPRLRVNALPGWLTVESIEPPVLKKSMAPLSSRSQSRQFFGVNGFHGYANLSAQLVDEVEPCSKQQVTSCVPPRCNRYLLRSRIFWRWIRMRACKCFEGFRSSGKWSWLFGSTIRICLDRWPSKQSLHKLRSRNVQDICRMPNKRRL